MENEIFTQGQEKLSRDAWAILFARMRCDDILGNHNSGNRIRGENSSFFIMRESSSPLFKIKMFFWRIFNGY